MNENWGNIPPWLPVTLPESKRRSLDLIIEALDVEKAARYARKGNTTYCNIFVWDVSKAAGVEVPHWYEAKSGLPTEVGHGLEMHANRMVEWLGKHWKAVTKEEAHAAAEAGSLVIVGWRNPEGIGHVAVMQPEGTIAQAGASNFVGRPVAAGFGNRPVKYFVSPAAPWGKP